MIQRLVLVANPDPVHVGAHLLDAARTLRLNISLCDMREAFAAPVWRRKVNWWLRGHLPSALRSFSEHVVATAVTERADCVLSTGIAPVDRRALEALGRRGITRLNFLTDDPWNAAHRAPWFLKALSEYDHVFTPRRANISDLLNVGGPGVSYLPFAFAPDAHFPDPPATAEERERFDADLVFVGGADGDRVDMIAPFIAAGFKVALYGAYWNRFASTRRSARGLLDCAGLRKAIAGARVNLCLVRRANRDGHAMRTFEVAAMGGCMLVEDTAEHRDIFAGDDDAVVYFRRVDDAIERLRELLADAAHRALLSTRVRALVNRHEHTYAARLRRMIAALSRAEVA